MHWPSEDLWLAIAPQVPGFSVEVMPTIDSTNTELGRRLRRGHAETVLLVAQHQTAGRGRLGRSWVTQEGGALTFSLGMPMHPPTWSGLSLAVGLTLVEALDPDGLLGLGIKWPNDLYWRDRKAGGILIENVIKNEKWALVVSDRMPWARRLWPVTEHYQMLGGNGGYGLGGHAPIAIGAALANKEKGILSVTFQPDGDMMYAPGVLWTAAHHKIPLLSVMHNNRSYHMEAMHVQRMCNARNRGIDKGATGSQLISPNIDYSMLAKSMGVEGKRVDRAGDLEGMLETAIKSNKPYLVEVNVDREIRPVGTGTWELPPIPHGEPNFRKLAGLDK